MTEILCSPWGRCRPARSGTEASLAASWGSTPLKDPSCGSVRPSLDDTGNERPPLMFVIVRVQAMPSCHFWSVPLVLHEPVDGPFRSVTFETSWGHASDGSALGQGELS